jgi:hypothetical protein
MPVAVYIPSFRPKDPDDVEPKNFSAAGRLALLGNPTVTSYEVFVDPLRGCADGALIISDVAYDPVTKRISFTWSGGTPGQQYCVTARLSFGVKPWKFDKSGLVLIAQR